MSALIRFLLLLWLLHLLPVHPELSVAAAESDVLLVPLNQLVQPELRNLPDATDLLQFSVSYPHLESVFRYTLLVHRCRRR